MVGGIFVEGWWRPLQTVRTRASEAAASRPGDAPRLGRHPCLTRRRRPSMACFPHPPAGTPPRRFVVAASPGNRRSRAVGHVGPTYAGRGYIPDMLLFMRAASGRAGGIERQCADNVAQVEGRHRLVVVPGEQRAVGEGRRCRGVRSEEHTSELQSLMRISYAVFCMKKKKHTTLTPTSSKQTTIHTIDRTKH